MNNFVGVKMRLGQCCEFPGSRKANGQQNERNNGLRFQGDSVLQLNTEQPQRPKRDQHVKQPEEQTTTHQAQMRHQQNREQDGHRERAKIIESQHLRNHVLEAQVSLHNAHDQRNFQPHHETHTKHGEIQHQLERCGKPDIDQKQQRRRKAAKNPDQQFNLDKARDQIPLDVTGQPRTDPHRKQISADYRGKLHHRIAEQIARLRGGDQLVSQAARSDNKNGKKECFIH